MWAVSHRTDDTVVLFGTVPSDDAPYVYASVEVQSDGSWALAGWGQCSLTVAAEGYSTANWILDPDVAPAPGASSVSVWVMERECAGGEPPVGRDIVPVVFADEGTVRMIVLIEQLEGDATCPSNPWYPVELDLGEPIGDRTLVDASVMPPLERPWPPSEASIQDPRDA